MSPIRFISFLFPVLLWLPATVTGFGCYIETGCGFQSGVPENDGDTLTIGNYPFCSIDGEPSWTSDSGGILQWEISLPINALKYINGTGELLIEQDISFEKKLRSTVAHLEFSAAYTYSPVTYDQTIPEHYFEWSLEFAQHSSGKIPFGGSYTFSLLRDIRTARLDFRHRVTVDFHYTFPRHWYLFAKIGGVWNISTVDGAGYLQPLASAGASCELNDRNMLIAHLYGAYSFYESKLISTFVPRGKSGKVDTLFSRVPVSRTPFATLYGDYDREIVPPLHVHAFYMFSLFKRGEPYTLYRSHQIGISLECNFERKR